jgi:single-stranded-DNA-specific exonuclease
MKIYSKIRGVTFQGRQQNIEELQDGQKLWWVKEHENPFDPNAVELYADSELRKSVGHLSRKVAEKVRFAELRVVVQNVTGRGEEKKNLGVNIVVETFAPNTAEVSGNGQI